MVKRFALLTAVLTLLLWAVPALSQAISGQVVDREGKPVPKARVEITLTQPDKSDPSGYSSARKETLVADKSGRFSSTITLPPEKSYAVIIVSAKGYCSTRQHYRQEEGAATVTLWPAHMLRGRVVDEKGKPLAGAEVVSNYRAGYGGSRGLHSTIKLSCRTAKDGTFALDGFPDPDDFRNIHASLSLSAPGRALVHRYISRDQLVSGAKFALPLACKIEGTLHLPGKTGPAPEGTSLMLRVDTDKPNPETRDAKVGKDGKFTVAQLPPGKASIVLGSQGFRQGKTEPLPWALPAVTGVVLSPGKPATLDLELVPGSLIKGTVVDKATGKVLANARLAVVHPGRPKGMYQEHVISDENGAFAARVAPGEAGIALMTIEIESVYHDFSRRPDYTKLSLADGEERSGLTIAADLTQQSEDSLWTVRNKPIPPDFELKPGTYNLTWDPDLDCSDMVYIDTAYEGEQVTARAKALPKLASTRAKRMAYRLDGPGDDGLFLVCLDESKGTGKGWDTAYFDLNRNGDLTDDDPVRFTVDRANSEVSTDWVTAKSRQGAGDTRTDHPVKISLAVYVYDDGKDIWTRFSRRGGWRGTIDSSKGSVQCAVADADCNGTFGDTMGVTSNLERQYSGDDVYIDANSFGRLVMTSYSPHSHRLQPKLTKVGDKFYHIKVTPLGDQMTVEPYTGACGQLLVQGKSIQGLDATPQSVSVVSEAGCYSFESLGGKPVTLPVGKCRIPTCDMLFDTPTKVNLTCSPDAPVTIEADKRTTVCVTGKLQMAIEPTKRRLAFDPGSSQSVNWDIKIGGTTVTALGDADRSNAPRVLFIRNGKVAGETKAQYG